MTDLPHFIALDTSSHEDDAHPIAIAWSLSDGRIKHTLIEPDDDWHDWDYALEDLHGITQDTLHQRGETCWAVMRELEQDLEQPNLLTDDLGLNTELLERLYEACQRELSLELNHYQTELMEAQSTSQTQLSQQAEDVQHTLQLNPHTCEDRVRLMLEVWVSQQGSVERHHQYEPDTDW